MKWLKNKIEYPNMAIVLACLTGYAVWFAAAGYVALIVVDWLMRHVRVTIV
jgi:hypothetical protein